MNRSQSIVLTTTIIGTLVNMYGAIRRGSDVTIPIIGGFVVTAVLLGLAETPFGTVAEVFGGAYLVTSASLNAGDLVKQINGLETGAPIGPAPAAQKPPPTGGAGGRPAVAQ
jgi:hypothetical protein